MYDVILADPPWQYGNQVPFGKTADQHYSTMSVKEISEIPVKSLIKDNSALFIWVTWPTLEDAWNVIKSWGFRYRTIGFLWVKARQDGFGFYTNQMGNYTRPNTEPCLLAIRGSMPVFESVHSLIYYPVMEHSRKPDEQYIRIETLYPGMKYLEMFARRNRPGWDAFGNEVENSIAITNRCSS